MVIELDYLKLLYVHLLKGSRFNSWCNKIHVNLAGTSENLPKGTQASIFRNNYKNCRYLIYTMPGVWFRTSFQRKACQKFLRLWILKNSLGLGTLNC